MGLRQRVQHTCKKIEKMKLPLLTLKALFPPDQISLKIFLCNPSEILVVFGIRA